jgi:hypothetical protein
MQFYINLFKDYFRSTFAILLFDDKKFKRIRLLTESYLDGLKETSTILSQKVFCIKVLMASSYSKQLPSPTRRKYNAHQFVGTL